MNDGDRADHFPENKSEFNRFEREHQENSKKWKIGEWRNNVIQGAKRALVAVRNRKTFPAGK